MAQIEPITWVWNPQEVVFVFLTPTQGQGIMPVVPAIRQLATNSYTVLRRGLGTTVAGRYAQLVPNTFSIRASIQPVTGADILRLPVGLRQDNTICIYTATPLRTAVAPGGNEADVVIYQGLQFEVSTVFDWSESGGFVKAWAKKLGQ